MIGIYCIKNLINGKVYIGQSKDIEKRWKEHRLRLKSKRKSAIKDAFIKYGINNFSFNIIEECKIEELNEKEIYYISFYDSTNKEKGYNLTIGGDRGPLKRGIDNSVSVFTKEEVWNIREMRKNGIMRNEVHKKYFSHISIYTFADLWIGKTYKDIHYDVYDIKPNYYKSMALHRAETTNTCFKYVQEIRNLKYSGKLTINECRKKYENILNKHTVNDIWYNRIYTFIKPTVENNYTKNAKIKRKINQYTLDNVFIATFENSTAAAKSIFKDYRYKSKNISNCCKGKQEIAYGFIWKYTMNCNDYQG